MKSSLILAWIIRYNKLMLQKTSLAREACETHIKNGNNIPYYEGCLDWIKILEDSIGFHLEAAEKATDLCN